MSNMKSFKEVLAHYEQMPDEIQWYFEHLPNLINDKYPYDIVIAYLFYNIELGHISTLYCGVVKLLHVDPELAWNVIEKEHLDRPKYRKLVNLIFGKSLSNNLIDMIKEAEKVRDKIMHGRSPSEQDKRDAIRDILDYAKGLNEEIYLLAGFKPYKDLTGFKGRLKSLDKSKSRWILKGIGFELS